MSGPEISRIRPSKTLVLRLLISYLLVPLVPPVLMLPPQDVWGIIGLYWLFGFAAMVVLGTPLLLLFLRLRWIGFFPFLTAGGLCAAVTAGVVNRGHDRGSVIFFGLLGVVSGVVFRILLFGIREDARVTEERVAPHGQA